MFKKILSSVGVGAAKVDFVLERNSVAMGEVVQGVLHIQGGNTEQQIEKVSVELKVKSSYSVKVGDRKKHMSVNEVVAQVESDPFVVKPGENLEWPVSFQVPENIPFSSLRTSYYFHTNLGIVKGMDAKDKDVVQVLPSGLIKNFLDGVSQLGLELYSEYYTGSKQVMYLRPNTGLKDQLEYIMFEYSPMDIYNGMYGHVEIYPRAKGLKRLFSGKVLEYSFSTGQLNTAEIAKFYIYDFIQSQLKV